MNVYQIAEQYTAEFTDADLPIDVFGYLDCLKTLGILRYTVHRLDSEQCGWLATRDGGRFYIAVNRRHSETRRRFTAAHELGHLFLHCRILTSNTCFDCRIRFDDDDLRERQANAFAAEFLMPRRLVYTMLDTGHRSITSLAREFKVSKEAMHWRLQTLRVDHDTDLDYVFWKTRGRHKAASSE